jgi:hypothetical protein
MEPARTPRRTGEQPLDAQVRFLSSWGVGARAVRGRHEHLCVVARDVSGESPLHLPSGALSRRRLAPELAGCLGAGPEDLQKGPLDTF